VGLLALGVMGRDLLVFLHGVAQRHSAMKPGMWGGLGG
jgi:hypothetical protein